MSNKLLSILRIPRPQVGNIFTSMSFTSRVSLYVFTFSAVTWLLFQKKLLPKPVSMIVSKIFFYPTFPITAIMRLGNYWTKLDDTLIMGCAPMGFLGHPEKLYRMGVRGVINMCYEYPGPKSSYASIGIKQLYLPTIDHFEPSVEQMRDAVEFIKEHKKRGEKVYVHCKAAHGRAASIALCWLINENEGSNPQVRIYYCLLSCIIIIFTVVRNLTLY